MFKHISILFFFIIFYIVLFMNSPIHAQLIDNKGDEFIFSFIPNIFDAEACEIYLSAETATDVTIEYPIISPTFTTTVSLTPGDVTVVSVPPEAANSWNDGQNLNNALRAFSTSGTEFSAVLANLKTGSSDAALALPVDALGTDYIVATYHTQANFNIDGARSEFIVTAVSDNTTLTITPRYDMAGTGGGYSAGVPFDVILNRGESFFGQDVVSGTVSAPGLAGTMVESDKPVAVVNGNKCTTVPVSGIQSGGCSHLFEMAIPTSFWSREVHLPPLGFVNSSLRVFAFQDNTEIRRYPGAPLYLGTFDRGDYVDTGIFNSPNNVMSGTNPVQVMQFSPTYLGSFINSAPSMSTLIPVEQYDNHYTFRTISDGRFSKHYVTIVANGRDVGTLTLDGVPIAETAFGIFTGFIGSTTECCFYAAVLPISEGVHQTASARGHWVRVTGVDSNLDAYAYPGGAWFDRPPVSDVSDPQATFVINGPDAFFNATDSISEDSNENLILDGGEDLNGDGVLNIDSGIASVSLAQPDNISLNVPVFKDGKGSVDFTVSLIDPCIPGSGNVWVRDCSGKLLSVPVQIPAVLCPNNPPLCDINPSGPFMVNPGEAVGFTASASDLNTGDQITLNVSPLPSGATMNPMLPLSGPGSGISSDFHWTPGSSQGGFYQLVYTVTDDSNASSTCTDYIRVNIQPFCGVFPAGPITVNEGDSISFFAYGEDPDSRITLDVLNLPAGASMNPPLPRVDDGEDGVASQFSWIPAAGQAGSYQVMFSITDDQGLVSNCSMDITVHSIGNSPPAADAGGPYTVDEGSNIVLDASASSDPDGDPLSFEWDFDYDGVTFDVDATGVTAAFDAAGLDGPGGRTVAVRVSDNLGAADIDQTTLTVDNVSPEVGDITAPLDPQPVGTAITAGATFTDGGAPDTFTATWDWGDGTTSTGSITPSAGGGAVEDQHIYVQPGTYTIELTVADDDGGSGISLFQFVVIYDPDGGFVTGGGWIDSPAGAYTADPTLFGSAHFGFVAKYKKGAMTPTGSTEFQFQAGDLNFHSNSYQWLVVAGARAMFKGEGTINGGAGYGFILTAIDGALPGGNGADKFRIKIWEISTGALVYDNQMGAGDNEEPDTVLTGGSIVIHDKGDNR
jgi:hypothetical protein